MDDMLDFMFAIQNKYPDMTWRVTENNNLIVDVPIDDAEAGFLMSAHKLFDK